MRGFFSKPGLHLLVMLFAILILTKTSSATTAVLLRDEQLIVHSRVILLGKVRSVAAQTDDERQTIYTYVKVRVTEVIKGELANETIVFKQLGGTVNDYTSVVFGAPDYQVGQRVLLFLNTASDGTLRITHLFQGKYDVVEGEAGAKERVHRELHRESLQVLGEQESPEITNSTTLAKFVKKIRKTLRQQRELVTANESRYAGTPIVAIPPEYIDVVDGEDLSKEIDPQYVLFSARWRQPDTGLPVVFLLNSSNAPVAGGGITEINQAMAAWTNVTTTALVMQNGGSTTAGGFRNQDGVSSISFNDPLGEIQDPVGCSGILAIGGYSRAGNPITTVGGQSFYSIMEGDVVFNNGFNCFLGISTNLAEVACHELGHAIGFNHSADTNAIMAPTAHGNGRGATLAADDIAAVSFLYPGSKSTTTVPAAPANLIATAASSSAINLTWGDNSNNESGFRIERKTGAAGAYGEIATVPAGQTTYSNTGLSASTTYYYRVRSYNTAGNSAYSSEANATTSTSSSLPPTGDADNDCIPNGVEVVENRNPLVKDNDIFTIPRLFVQQQYRDFLGREGDAAGVSYWTNQLSSGAVSRVQLVNNFFTSVEFQAVPPITRLYFAYFLRIPDYNGLLYWVGQYRAGQSLNTISDAFAASAEFQQRYGSLSDAQFVALLYQNVLGRAGDAAGLAHWTNQLTSGAMTRGQVMLAFSESGEFRGRSANWVFVVQMYVGMLRRAPEQFGFDTWVGQMAAGRSGLDLINACLGAPEYRSRFLP